MTPAENLAVTVKHSYSASAERVFDAWLDPQRARRFLFATPEGEMVKAEIDARVGGRFVFVERRQGEDVAHEGRYEVIDRPQRLVFTFAVPKYSEDVTRVSVSIVSRADGGCDLTLVNEKVPREWLTQTESGWTTILASLERALA